MSHSTVCLCLYLLLLGHVIGIRENVTIENAEVLDIANVFVSKHRVKRDGNTYQTMHIQSAITDSNSEIKLILKTNNNMLISNIEWRSKNRIRRFSEGVGDCLFLSGVVSGKNGSSASLVSCGSLVSGLLISPDNQEPIFIEPLRAGEDGKQQQHVLYRAHTKPIDLGHDQITVPVISRTRRLAYRANVTQLSFLDDYENASLDESSGGPVEVSHEDDLGSGVPPEPLRPTATPYLEELGYALDKLWEQEVVAESRGANRPVASKSQPPRWLKLALTVDHSVIGFHGRDQVQLYVLSLMNIVSAVYKDPSLDSNLRLAIVKLLFLEDEEDCKVVEGSSKASLESVNRWNEVEAQNDSPPLASGLQRDAAVWLTRVDLGGPSGYAPVSGVCDPARSCTLNRDEGLTSAFIIAHELGHVLGLSHDGDLAMGNNCTMEAQRGSVMAAMVSATFHRFHWSLCSRSEFHSKAEQWGCLSTKPRGADTTLLSSLVNASFSMDEQCRMEFGEGFSLCRSFDLPSPCAHLWCSHLSSPQVCRTKKGPPLEGTECGPNQWCVSGHCEEADQRQVLTPLGVAPVLHNARDGGWGSWVSWQSCSRTCGLGVSFRTRVCNAPTPQYGGTNCRGRSEEFRICARQQCRPPLRDFRAEQCSAMSLASSRTLASTVPSETIQGKSLREWLPLELGPQSLKCQLICIGRESGKQLRTAENLLDGTRCSYDQQGNDVCIQGICQKLGCDGELDSDVKEDMCGVCGGNDSECHNITVKNTKVVRRPLTKLAILPQNARHIRITISSSLTLNASSVMTLLGRLMVRDRRKTLYRLRSKPAPSVVEGTRFHLNPEGSSLIISARGPLLTEIILLISSTEKQYKSRILIKAEVAYVLHREQLEDEKYRWEIGGWGPCSASCGATGKQQRTFACRHQPSGKLVPRKHCPLVSRPSNIPSQSCLTPQCWFHWEVRDWEHCSSTCGSRGMQQREVFCAAVNQSAEMVVHPALCPQQPPIALQACNRIPCPVHWVTGNWSQCSSSCGAGLSRRSLRCSAPRGEPLFHCGPPPNDTLSCFLQSCSASKSCDNLSPFCGLPLLHRYCVLPVFQQLCCRECKAINL